MKKILFIVTESGSANGICTKAVMEEHVRRGDKVFCLTNREMGQGREDKIMDGVSYSTVTPRLCYRLSARICALPGGSGRRKLLSAVHFVLNKTKLLLSYPTWPLISPAYAARIYRRGLKICKAHGIDAVIPIYTQIDTLIAAKRIKAKLPQVKFIPYFLDALSGGYGPKVFSRQWTERRGLKWEAKLLGAADKIIMMRSVIPHYEKYRDKLTYFDKICFLDLPLFRPQVSGGDSESASHGDKNIIELLFVGTIPAHIRDPKYFIELFGSIGGDDIRLTLIGSSTCESYLADAAKMDGRIKLMGRVDHERAMAAMRRADILVNFGNNDPGMTPSKIFEYMSLGKPIISTAPIKDEPSLVYLQKYPCKYVVDQSLPREEHVAALESFIRESVGKTVAAERLTETFYLNTPAAFVECITREI